MNKILVPTDFSPISDNALEYACQIALQMKSEIYLLNIQSLPANDDASMAIELIKTIEESAIERLKQKESEILSEHKGITITTHFSFGIPSLTIKEFLETNTFNLVIMGTRGATGVDKFLFGSVAESISKHSPCPVMIIHPDNKFRPIKHMAVPIDINYKFGESHKIVQKVVEYAEALKSELSWFYVNTQSKEYQEDIHYMLKDGKKIDIEIVDGLIPEDGIMSFCQTHPVDLLIILKRDYTVVHQLFHHNIFKEIVNELDLPIMVVHY
jgi:nucleotide-binding universal stress UspA family protein